jgi:hypothetical protein
MQRRLHDEENARMRFMVLLKANRDSETGMLPSTDLLAAMGKYNEELVKAGVLIDGAGLQASAKGARITFSGARRTVIDGPFPETNELIAGYWMFQVRSKAEAIEWVKRCPNPHAGDAEIEIRQVFEIEDFPKVPDEVRELELQQRKPAKRLEAAAN